jgi:Protein of unknown function (DUF3574)
MRHGVSALGLLSLGGCISLSEMSAMAPAHCSVGKPMVETMLFLGMASPNGPVSRYAFQNFVEAEVTPRWREGYTILEGEGLWYSDQRQVTEREPSRVLVRFHDGGAAASAAIDAIRAAYIKQFAQDAVLRTDRATCADF